MSNNLLGCKGFVLMLDALGVRNISKNEAEHFVDIRESMISRLKLKLPTFKMTIQTLIHDKLDEEIININDINNYEDPEFIEFADNIVMHWNLPYISFDSILIIIGKMLETIIPHGIKNQVLWRGAFSVGEYYIGIKSKTTLLGPAIVDVASWHEAADWIGIIATPKCGIKLESRYVNEGKGLSPYLKYKVPLKEKTNGIMWVVKWVNEYCGITEIDFIEKDKQYINSIYVNKRTELCNDLSKMTIPKGTELKYENTLKYWDCCVNDYLEKINQYKSNV